ncbi:MAG: hypothetical protein AAB509_00190 [Patescibacteria group bacterium]
MNKYINQKLLLAIPLLAILLFPISTSAQITITGMVDNVGRVIGQVAVAIVIIFWIITGILFLSAQGDPTKLATAKKALFAAIGGTVISIVAASAVGIITTAIMSGR